MAVYELNINLKDDKNKNHKRSQLDLDKDKILCDHCKRTSSNGIRCLGKCVADNDY